MLSHLLALFCLTTFSHSFASSIAVIDSGVDLKHQDLKANQWINPTDLANNNRDEDRNGYQDDVFGWNFAENNNQIIDYKYLGTFSNDPYKFFDIQGKRFLGTASAEELQWMEEKIKDTNFRKELGVFGNFIHGTHVAGITARANPEAKVMAIKLIPTKVKPFAEQFLLKHRNTLQKGTQDARMEVLKKLLDALAQQQAKMLEEIGTYINGHKIAVANLSFGTSYAVAKNLLAPIFKTLFRREATEEEMLELAGYLVNQMANYGKKMMESAPQTLFVVAAGNDGANNDIYPTSPANIKMDNAITVAATFNYDALAKFSNYGIKMVEVGAPGVVIESSIPGDEYLKVSGTSQAAPFVANVAARLKQVNPNLSAKDIKAILMGTVDLKTFLGGKILTSGIVNLKRAVAAAESSRDSSIAESIVASRLRVRDVKTKLSLKSMEDVFVLPLPSSLR